ARVAIRRIGKECGVRMGLYFPNIVSNGPSLFIGSPQGRTTAQGQRERASTGHVAHPHRAQLGLRDRWICYRRREVPTLALIVASVLCLAPAGDVAGETARRLFDEGIARCDAADYKGAIEVFTLALGEVRGQGVDHFTVRGLLLFNIGR